jgi:hypothetical protein
MRAWDCVLHRSSRPVNCGIGGLTHICAIDATPRRICASPCAIVQRDAGMWTGPLSHLCIRQLTPRCDPTRTLWAPHMLPRARPRGPSRSSGAQSPSRSSLTGYRNFIKHAKTGRCPICVWRARPNPGKPRSRKSDATPPHLRGRASRPGVCAWQRSRSVRRSYAYGRNG